MKSLIIGTLSLEAKSCLIFFKTNGLEGDSALLSEFVAIADIPLTMFSCCSLDGRNYRYVVFQPLSWQEDYYRTFGRVASLLDLNITFLSKEALYEFSQRHLSPVDVADE